MLPARKIQATSAVEVGVAMLILAALGIPMLNLLFQGRDTEQRSKFEFLADLAASDEMYQARMIAACGGVEPASAAHGRQALTGNPFARLSQLNLFRGTVPDLTYPGSQARVQTEVTVQGPLAGASPRIHLARVTAWWRDPALPVRDDKKTTVVLPFGILKPK